MSQSGQEGQDGRSERIAGIVARVCAKAVHDAILADELVKTSHGRVAVADALLEFARALAKHHYRGVDHLIEAANLARNAQALIEGGGV